jgi:hypothetical protein
LGGITWFKQQKGVARIKHGGLAVFIYIYIFVFAVDFPEYVITHWNIDDYIIFGFASRKFKENTHIK